MFVFSDGTRLTNRDAAALIRAEPFGLIHGILIDSYGHRCAGGVILGSTFTLVRPKELDGAGMGSLWLRMVRENNAFIGTPKARQEFMAAWLDNEPD